MFSFFYLNFQKKREKLLYNRIEEKGGRWKFLEGIHAIFLNGWFSAIGKI